MSQTLHQKLLQLHIRAKAWLETGYTEGFKPKSGICMNVELDNDEAASLYDLMDRWPGGSDVPCYPVPMSGWPASLYYTHADPARKWNPEHEYARNRWALLEWLIEQTASEADQ